MALRRARSIDRLHSLVADHELVLTSDAPLALALNRRARQARLGDFALTPRAYAKQGLEVADRREMFHELVRRTELSFKQAARDLDLALRCWEDTGDLEAILEQPRHRGEPMQTVVDVVSSLETAYSLREDVTIPDSVDLAVIDPDSLSALDRAVLPDETAYDTIEPFAEAGSFDPGGFELLPSTLAIVETLEAHITPANAGDVGVVLDPSGPVRPLLEATLEARSIPYHTEEQLAEHPGLRSFLRVLRLGLTREHLRAGEVRGLLAELGRGTSPRDDDKRLTDLDDGRLAPLRELWDELEDLRLGEALDRFADMTDPPRELGELVDELELAEAPITRDLLDALAFYLDTYPIERDYDREGVLLASGRDNAYVDRPLVFHVGLGTGWAQSVPEDPWLGPEQLDNREARDVSRFERLLQSGRRRVYLVQDTRGGQPVTPCFHLHELLDAEFERFAELPHRQRRAPQPQDASAGFEPEPGLADVDAQPIETLSSNDLDRLTYCPREWFVDQLVPTTETRWLRRGQLFHAFAALCAENPGLVDPEDEALLAELVDVALEELGDLLDPELRPAEATELAIGFRAIADLIDRHPPTGEPAEVYTDPPPERRTDDNPFAEVLDVEPTPSRTERWFRSTELGVHGMVDLLHAPRRLVDWKSTRNPDSLLKTVRRAQPEAEEPPSLQPAVYLLHHRDVADERLDFTFVDLLDERRAAIRGETDAEDVTRRLVYHPRSFAEHVATREAYEYATQSNNKREDVFEAVGYEAYRRYVENSEVPPLEDKDEAEATDFAEGLVELAQAKRGAPSKSEKAARGAVRKLVDLKRRTLFCEDLDRVGDHVQALLEDLERWRQTRFPVPEDVDMDELDHRELVLRDLRAHRGSRRPTGGGPDA